MLVLSLLSLVLAAPVTLAVPSSSSARASSAQILGCRVPASTLQVPSNQTQLVAPTTPPTFVALGVGVQNYTCSNTSTYTNVGAVADLFDISCLHSTSLFPFIQDIVYGAWSQVPSSVTAAELIDFVRTLGTSSVLGQHYFVPNPTGSGLSPKFDFTSNPEFRGNPEAYIIAARGGDIPSPTSKENIDWLELNNIQGKLAQQVFRVETKAGQPSNASCTPGSPLISVKYTAKYPEFIEELKFRRPVVSPHYIHIFFKSIVLYRPNFQEMARFTAYASDTSEEEEEYQEPAKPPPHSIPSKPIIVETDQDDEAEMSDASSSRMAEDELTSHPPRRKPRDKRALVEEEDGEFYDAHELEEVEDGSEESSSSSSETSPRNERRAKSESIPWPQQVGVDSNRMHVMQASLFRMPEEEEALKAASMEKFGRVTLTKTKTINRKHSRDSEGDGLRSGAQERASFAHDIEPIPYRPSRKYARVDSLASAVTGNEGAMVDAGLALGRSFRVGWGPSATLIHLGTMCAPSSNPKTTANSSILTKALVPFAVSDTDAASISSNLLQHHLSTSPILTDSDGIPFASPATNLNFASFASVFPPSDRSFEALLFRLGHALFDDIDLHLQSTISIDVRNRIYAVRRKTALSSWLEEAVAPAVEEELKSNLSAGSVATAFSRLTGHQVEKACEAAMDGRNVKLATLISQAGGDYEFQEDLRSQLQIWREERIDAHIDEDIRKVYALLAGIVDVLEGSSGTGIEQCPHVSLAQGLDWKRVFGLHLWFAQPMDAPIADVFDAYEQHWRNAPERAAPPVPWYSEKHEPVESIWRLPTDANPPDALYSLIRLYADPACSLSHICSPLSFGPSPIDYSIPWHLYILLSRCMRVRDFADRDGPRGNSDSELSDEEEETIEGHSPSADLLASSYALQLEQMDLIQQAVFVLLHIEGSTGREKAIKDLLARSAPKLDDWMTRGIAGSLKIPLSWINEAKAIYALDNGNVYEAYQLYLQAGLYNAAHELAVLELAPEAVVRDDLELLQALFGRIAGHSVDGWHVRGKAFLDYVNIRTRMPELRTHVLDPETVPDASQADELEELTKSIPKLIHILPNVLRDRSNPRHNVALSDMISELTRELDSVQPLALGQVKSMPVEEATKLRHIHYAVYARFLKSIQVT
ncbi:hypothetical protein EW146_g347 [Bondarzewia mesenterica]|uniref:Nuclear pore complex protein NUP96 C-terminal domain-containing protein n=1 Tax=Bondarzewia mesenterica TaxID=1095465 RepID=A0A4S4M955_9AGAM|nr:hypothetical protein EW146_g347 [Bondarzewia mesenterica]